MKNLIAIMTLLFAISANASSSGKFYTNLTAQLLEHAEFEGEDDISMMLDLEKESLQLTVYRRFRCPANMFCAQVMPAPLIIELPIVSVEEDSCGWRTYTAFVDKTPVDGLRETLTLTDYSQNICHVLAVLPGVHVSYETFNPWVNESAYSTFKGGALYSLIPMPTPVIGPEI